MRKQLSVLTFVAAGVMGAMSAGAQILPPAPSKTPATPEYKPPPPPPAPPTAPTPKGNPPSAEPTTPDAPLPTIVERDGEGKLKPLGMPAEEAAVRALKPGEETMKKVESSLGGRRDDLDRLVIENVEALVELKKFAAEVTEKTSLEEISTKAKKALPFKNFNGVLERLSREGAIDPQMKARAAKVAQEYTKASEADMLKGFEHGNTQAMVLVGFRRYLATTTTEAFGALDRMLGATAPRMEDLLDRIPIESNMRGEVVSKMRKAPKPGAAGADAKRAEIMGDIFFNTFQAAERQAWLKEANPKLFAGQPEKNDAEPAPKK